MLQALKKVNLLVTLLLLGNLFSKNKKGKSDNFSLFCFLMVIFVKK